MPAIVGLLLQLLPGLIESISRIVNAVRAEPGLPAETQAQLDAIAVRLDSTLSAVADLEIREV